MIDFRNGNQVKLKYTNNGILFLLGEGEIL